MSEKYLLPLYYIRKRDVNEKTLLLILLGITVFGILVVFLNLPSGNKNDEIGQVFMPKIRHEDLDHEGAHKHPTLPISSDSIKTI